MIVTDEARSTYPTEIVDVVGYQLHSVRGHRIHMIRVSNGREIRLGQRVYANGRFGAEDGTLGLVTNLATPFSGCRTSDIIDVWFEGFDSAISMKAKDLRPEK